MPPKVHVTFTAKQKLEYAKLMINEGYTHKQIRDNSVMQRCFRSLKSERLNHLSFIHHVAAVSTVESYIYFYNYKRLHSTLGYITPVQKMAELNKAA
jgi:transposase InsO family protein